MASETLRGRSANVVIPPEVDEALVITEEDGAVVNLDTGEVYGYAGAPFVLPPLDDVARATMTRAEIIAAEAERDAQLKAAVLWATERRARATAKITGLDAEKKALIEGVESRFAPQINEQSRKVDWIDLTYGKVMESFASAELAGTGKKQVKLPWGTLKFTAGKGKLTVSDTAMAAYTLIEGGFVEAVEITVDMAALNALAQNNVPEAGEAQNLWDAILGAFLVEDSSTPDPEETHPATPIRSIDAVKLIPAVEAKIKAAKVPAVLPKSLQGLERATSDNHLGGFSVAH